MISNVYTSVTLVLEVSQARQTPVGPATPLLAGDGHVCLSPREHLSESLMAGGRSVLVTLAWSVHGRAENTGK